MPFSFLTRFLAALIVTGVGAALLWPHPEAMDLGKSALPVLPLVLAWLTFSAVRDAPPLDDRAFHRTLPVSRSAVIRRIALLRGMVLVCVMAAIVVRGVHFNLGSATIIRSLAVAAVPMLMVFIFIGFHAALLGAPESGRGRVVLLACLFPAVALVTWMTAAGRHVETAGWIAVMIAMALPLFSALFWLGVNRRRSGAAMVLAAAVSLVVPWTSILFSPVWRLMTGASSVAPMSGVVVSGGTTDFTDLRIEGMGEMEFVRCEIIDPEGRGFREADLGADANGGWIDGGSILAALLEKELPSPTPWAAAMLGGHADADAFRQDSPALLPAATVKCRRYPSGPAVVYRWAMPARFAAGEGGVHKLASGGVLVVRPVETNDAGFACTVEVVKNRDDGAAEFPVVVAIAHGQDGVKKWLSLEAYDYAHDFMLKRWVRVPGKDPDDARQDEAWWRGATLHVFLAEPQGAAAIGRDVIPK